MRVVLHGKKRKKNAYERKKVKEKREKKLPAQQTRACAGRVA
jgi:hypothetical protein